MERLPSTEQQHAVFEKLARFLAKCGADHFVESAMLVPNTELLDAATTRVASGVAMVAYRMLQFVGHGTVRIRVEVEADSATEENPHCAAFEQGVPAWYDRMDGDVFVIGIDDALLGDPTILLGALAHVVAHVDLTIRGWPEADEITTDLAAIALGFGVFVANATDVHRSTGTYGTYRVSQASVGFLGLQSAAFALAVQSVARGLDGETVRDLVRHLDPNQAECFRAARDHLASGALIESLRLTRTQTRQESAGLEALPNDLDDDVVTACASFDVRTRAPVVDPPHSTFRVRGHRGMHFALLGCVVAIIACMALSEYLVARTVMIVWATATCTFWAIGTRVRWDSCSRGNCRALIPVGSSVCPKCRATVRGEISSMERRLEAEDTLQDEQRPTGYRD